MVRGSSTRRTTQTSRSFAESRSRPRSAADASSASIGPNSRMVSMSVDFGADCTMDAARDFQQPLPVGRDGQEKPGALPAVARGAYDLSFPHGESDIENPWQPPRLVDPFAAPHGAG